MPKEGELALCHVRTSQAAMHHNTHTGARQSASEIHECFSQGAYPAKSPTTHGVPKEEIVGGLGSASLMQQA
jgi:hypothetical protein